MKGLSDFFFFDDGFVLVFFNDGIVCNSYS